MEDSLNESSSFNEETKPSKTQLSNHDSKYYEDTLVRLVQRGKRLREAMAKSLQQTSIEIESRANVALPVDQTYSPPLISIESTYGSCK